MKDYLKLARMDHWVKNGFIVPGIFVAYLLVPEVFFEWSQLLVILQGVAATCLVASANYIINEWLDAKFDQYHPVKKKRPMVTKNLKVKYILLEYILFALVGMGLSFFIGFYFFLSELLLLIMGLLYNVKPFRTKDVAYLDVLTESVNNIIRFLLGWFMVTHIYLPPVSILFGYWMAGAFLMATKRFAEYRMIGDPELAGKYRRSFQYYSEKSLAGCSLFYAISATFAVGIFLVKYRVEYIFCIPLLFLLFAYYFALAFQEDSAVQKPEKLYREKKLMVLVGAFIVLVILCSWFHISMPEFLHEPYLMPLE